MYQYNKSKRGKLLSFGSEHLVYSYDVDKVIKFSLIHFFYGKKKGLQWAHKELEISKQYFGEFLLNTEIVISKNKGYFAQLQPKITGHHLTAKDLDNKILYQQFLKIVDCYHQMYKDGQPEIDLIGQKGIFKKCMSNIFVLNNNQLVIMDATLFNTKCPIILKPIITCLRYLVLPIQNRRIDEFLAQKDSTK
jgi:hypothetical protein